MLLASEKCTRVRDIVILARHAGFCIIYRVPHVHEQVEAFGPEESHRMLNKLKLEPID